MIIANVRYLDPNVPKIEAIEKGDWIDLRACSMKINGKNVDWSVDQENGLEYIEYNAGDFLFIGLGVAIQCPDHHEAHIAPRSSTFKNYSLIQTNGVGVVDYLYRGNNDQWFVPMYALGSRYINKYDRIVQFRFVPKMCKLTVNEMEKFKSVVDRGGHGSTGKQ